ncbi:MAG: M23 family metallopeptidase [Planctomycetota bacterium]
MARPLYKMELDLFLDRPATDGKTSGLRWPIGYEHVYRQVTQTYGQLEYCPTGSSSSFGTHLGLDIDGSEEGTPVYAVLPGVVTHVRTDSLDAAGVVIATESTGGVVDVGDFETPLSLKYLHLHPRTISVKKDETVEAGHMLGHVVYEYDVQPPHLHLSVLKNAPSGGTGLPADYLYGAGNPLRLLSPQAIADGKPATIQAELFVCSNDESGGVTLKNLYEIGEGEVDIVVGLRDKDGLSDVIWHAPYEVSLALTPMDGGRSRVMSIQFHDKAYKPANRVYLLSGDETSVGCWQEGRYRFNFVMTNDSGAVGTEPQTAHSWDAREGDYVVRFAMRDVAGNTYISSAEMIHV